jgi:hypothetical protein
MATLTETDRTGNIWRQYFLVGGDSLRLVTDISNVCLRDPAKHNTLILKGDGPYFPPMHGTSWAARCAPRLENDVVASDLTPLLRVLLDATLTPLSDAPREEIEAWLREWETGR